MQLIRLLSDGAFHSGEELGSRLGISRTAIWKQLAAWKKRGLAIEVVSGKGYRLVSPMEWWSADALRMFMSPEARSLLTDLRLEDRVGSTNDAVLEVLRRHPRSGVVCLAEEQTSGRGRRGREWFSPLCGNFYGSIGWVFSGGISEVEGLSLAVGVAVVRALNRYGMQTAALKWPNDIVVGDAKLGGVLIELQAEAEGACLVVIGLGLNLRLPENASALLGRPVTDVARETDGALRRNELGAFLLQELLSLLSQYPHTGFAAVHADWLRHDVLRDAEVVVSGMDRDLTGIAGGVDAHGALRLLTDDGETILLHGGEVSLRKSAA